MAFLQGNPWKRKVEVPWMMWGCTKVKEWKGKCLGLMGVMVFSDGFPKGGETNSKEGS